MPRLRLRSTDGVAALLSSLCLLHCLALPVLAMLLPVLTTVDGEHDHGLHAALLALALPVSLWALAHGWRRHRDRLPGVIAFVGFALMVGALALAGTAEAALTVAGGLAVALAHVRNVRGLAAA